MADGQAQPSVPADAVLVGNDAGLDFVAALAAWGQGLLLRLQDTADECGKLEAVDGR